jgi:hypothetical protein
MPALKDAVIVLAIILGCCIFLALGAFLGKKGNLGKLVRTAGMVALAAVVIYTIYISVMLLIAK